MDIFSQIEGLSGENLGSALFQYLIFNSHEVRNALIDLLSDESPIGPISYDYHFSCRTEYPTTHKQLGQGRLDILIQLDGMVIGIENKFFSQFQQGQPEKYFPSLSNVAKSLKSINHADTRWILYILCPENREKEGRAKIQEFDNVSLITWEQVIVRLSSVENISNSIAGMVKEEFLSYLKRHFSFVHDFERKALHLRKSFPEYGTTLQSELAGKLWPLIPSPGRRLSNGQTWIGYYFYTDPEVNEKGWIGFVPRTEIDGKVNNEAELIVAATYAPNLAECFEKIRLKSDNFIGAPGRTHAWVINFEQHWNSIDKWRDYLRPFWEAIPNDIT